MKKNRYIQKVQISRRIELWIELDLEKTIAINLFIIQALSRQ